MSVDAGGWLRELRKMSIASAHFLVRASRDLFGQVISPYHSDQMSQKSQVSRFTLLCCEDFDC